MLQEDSQYGENSVQSQNQDDLCIKKQDRTLAQLLLQNQDQMVHQDHPQINPYYFQDISILSSQNIFRGDEDEFPRYSDDELEQKQQVKDDEKKVQFQKQNGNPQIQFKYIEELMKPIKKEVQEKNLPRFLYRHIINHFYKYKYEFEDQIFQKIQAIYTRVKQQSKSSKKKVYLIKHLKQILDNEQQLGIIACQKSRKILSQILMKYPIAEMLKPKSQIRSQNLVKYLRTAKVYALRCRNKQLIGRIQSQ